jgi:hypothetical protein
MNEQELRTLVREAIARHLGTADQARGQAAPPAGLSHESHGRFVLPDGMDAGGACIIEPAVPCNHCGYCKSLGH